VVDSLGASRRRARERALEILYEAAIKERPVDDVLAALALAPDPYAVTLVRSAEAHRARAEELIERHARDWSLERLSLVDRIVMTMALGELLLEDAPPVAVVLDEAVELARTYSSDEAPGFVNGVLAACVRDLP
jgi:transcription antitermination protein NusB